MDRRTTLAWYHTITRPRVFRHSHDFPYWPSFPENSYFSIPMAFPLICFFYRTLARGKLYAYFVCVIFLRGSDGQLGVFARFDDLSVVFPRRLGAFGREKSCPHGGSGKMSSSMAYRTEKG